MKFSLKKKNKKLWIFSLLAVVGVIIIAFLLKYDNRNVPTTNSVTTKPGCQEENLASNETFTYFDQQTKQPKIFLAGPPAQQITDAKKWESDAYLVAMIHGENTTTQPVSFLYASNCTPHYLLLTDEAGNNQFSAHVVTSHDPILYVTPSLFVDLAQVSYDAPLNLSQINTTIPVFIQSPEGNTVTIEGKAITADAYAIQLNMSKRYGQIYQVMYMNGGHLSAVVTYDKNGYIMTLNTY